MLFICNPFAFKMLSKSIKTVLNLFLLSACALTTTAWGGAGLLGMDHEVPLDQSGIWARKYQTSLEFGSAALVIGGALWEGSDTRLGQTYWKSIDSMLMGDVSATVLKDVFRRQRPIDGNNPNNWFQPSGNASFPSGEVTHITSVVTPFIAEYGQQNPEVWLLALLPMYDGLARLKSQAHWQSDVLGGAALGVFSGLHAHNLTLSWTASVLPGGFTIGYRKVF
jgi:undecaprenyl-diphosphatase